MLQKLPMKCIYFDNTIKSYRLITKGVPGSVPIIGFDHAQVVKYNQDNSVDKNISRIMEHKSLHGWD